MCRSPVVVRLSPRTAGLQALRSLGRLHGMRAASFAFLRLRARILGNATRSCGL